MAKPKKKAAKTTKKPAAKAKKPAAVKKAKKPVAKAKKPVAKAKKPVAKPAKAAKAAARTDAETEKLAQASHAVMDATWSRWGALDADVIAHAINPTFMGGPRWPGMRQAYRVAQSGGLVLIASDGLSDPFDPGFGPESANGVGLEMFAVTGDDIAREGASGVTRFGATWLHDLVFQSAHLAASHGGIGAILDDLGAITSELYDVKIPATHTARFVNPHGRVGVLFSPGFATLPPQVKGPLGPIRLVHVQLLTLEELAHVMAGGDTARRALAQKLAGTPSGLDRPSSI